MIKDTIQAWKNLVGTFFGKFEDIQPITFREICLILGSTIAVGIMAIIAANVFLQVVLHSAGIK